MERRKKLIEVALPLEAINKEAAREKSIWHGHPSMLYSDNLTVEKILAGNSNIRNPILVSYLAKGLLPYHGLGSGIKRALDAWPRIEFTDDHDGCLFTATVHRKAATGRDPALQENRWMN